MRRWYAFPQRRVRAQESSLGLWGSRLATRGSRRAGQDAELSSVAVSDAIVLALIRLCFVVNPKLLDKRPNIQPTIPVM